MGNIKVSAQDGIGYGVPVARVVTAPTTRLDYEKAKNKPTINGVELLGELTTEDLGLDSYVDENGVKRIVADALSKLGVASDADIKDLFPDLNDDTEPDGQGQGDQGDDQGQGQGDDDDNIATDQDIIDLFG